MKVCALSDIHGTLIPIEQFPTCELVCICGDISPTKIQSNTKAVRKWLLNEFKPWCESINCDKILFIAGNHDFGLRRLDFMYEHFPKDGKITYLFHEDYTYNSKDGKEYKIFGTPYCKIFGNWEFMKSNDELRELYSQIPKDLDILMTHDQPYEFGDVILQNVPWNTGEHIGNEPLNECIFNKQPKILLCGHLHTTTHDCVMINDTKRYNVSIKDEYYYIAYNPLCLEI